MTTKLPSLIALEAHARKSPAERLGAHPEQLLAAIVEEVSAAGPRAEDEAAIAVRSLAPCLYDLWLPAMRVPQPPRWLAPLVTMIPPSALS